MRASSRVERLLDRLVERLRLADHAGLGDLHDLPLGLRHQLVGRLRAVVGVAEDLVAGVDQAADHRRVADHWQLVMAMFIVHLLGSVTYALLHSWGGSSNIVNGQPNPNVFFGLTSS